MPVKKVLLSFSDEEHERLFAMKKAKAQTWEEFFLALADRPKKKFRCFKKIDNGKQVKIEGE
jgi:hypothetical protein